MEFKVNAEEDVLMMQTEVIVGDQLQVGSGAITAGERSETEINELAKAVERHRVAVDPNAPSCCIDGRPCVHTLNGTDTEPRAKIAGGGAITAYAAAEMVGSWFSPNDSGTPVERYARVDEALNAAGLPTGVHIDTHAEQHGMTPAEGRTGCGANDKLPQNVANIFDMPEVVNGLTAAVMGDENYDAGLHLVRPALDGWNAVEAAKVPNERDANAVEVLDTGEDQPNHGHAEILVVFNDVEDSTIDRDALVAETGKQVFVVDTWYIKKMAKALARGPEAAEQEQALEQAMVAYQIGTYLSLCDGTQRPMFIKQAA